MSSSRKAIRQLACPLLGGLTGNVLSGTALTCIATEIQGGYNDSYFIGWHLIFPDAVAQADRDRVVTAYTGATGTLTWAGNRSATYTSETYELYPPDAYNLSEINASFDRVLQKTRHVVAIAVPTVDSMRNYWLAGSMPWIRGPQDVFRVIFYRNSSNMVGNSDFRWWGAGQAAAPSMWTLAGAGAVIARSGLYVPPGAYSALVTRAGTNVTLTHSIGVLGFQANGLQGIQVTAGAVINCAVASRARIGINDGVTTTYSAYHTGAGGPVFLPVTKTLSASATLCDVIASVDTGDTTGYFANVLCVEGSSVQTQMQNNGDLGFETPIIARRIGHGISLDQARGRGGQLIIYSRQPYPTLAADSTVTDANDDLVKHGVIADLSRQHRYAMDPERWDKLYRDHMPAYTLLANQVAQWPPPQERNTVLVRGA